MDVTIQNPADAHFLIERPKNAPRRIARCDPHGDPAAHSCGGTFADPQQMRTALPLFYAMVLLAACSAPTPQANRPATLDSAVARTGTPKAASGWVGYYKGTLLCADCPGIETQLWVRGDSTFFFLQHYIERDTVPYGSFGKWYVRNGSLATGSGTDKPEFWRPRGNGLINVDDEGQDFDTPLPMVLERGEFDWQVPTMRLQGLYHYANDQESFSAFDSDLIFPLDISAARDRMMRLQTKTGQPVAVEINAHVEKPEDDNNGYLKVDRFVKELRTK